MTTWEHVLVAVITTLPAIIAAWSSLRNGKRLENGQQKQNVSPTSKKLGAGRDGWDNYYQALKKKN